jgi:autotransporter-associated beta strand protein
MRTSCYLKQWSLFLLVVLLSASSALSATVTYNQRIAYYTTWGDGGGAFNQGADEVGMYANFSAKQTAAWRYFKTAGNVNHGGGTNRELRHGDEFTITVYGDAPYGTLGVAILDGPATGSWANRHSNARAYVDTAAVYGNWFINYNGGSIDSGANIGDEDDSIEFKITSSSTFNARVDGGSWNYNLPMLNSPANTDLVDSFSLYYADDYSGTGNENAYWKQTSSVENQGTLDFGGTSATTPGYINDGRAADSTSTVSVNKLFKFGSHTLTLVWTNDFSGGTQIEAGTLRAGHDRAFGAVPGSVDADNIILWGGATLELTNTFSFAANRGLTIDNAGNGIVTVSPTYTATIAGIITSDASTEGLIKLGTGGLSLSGANTYIGSTFISNGTLRISHGTGLGTTAGNTTVLPDAALEVLGGISSAEPIVMYGVGVAGAGALRNISGSNTNSGTISLSGNGSVAVDSGSDALTLSGVISATSATNNFTKSGPGVVHLTANNSFGSQLVISGGVVSVSSINASASANQPLGARSSFPSVRLGSTASSGSSRGTLRYAGGSSAVTPKTIRLTEGSQGGIEVVTNGVDLEISGVISIGDTSASLYKTGSGRLILSGVNTYDGQTRVEAGVLRVTNADGLGDSANSANQDTYVSSGAAVEISGGITVAERFNLNGTGVSSGGALRNISGSNVLSGRIFLDGAARINADADWLNIVNATAITSTFGLTFGGSGNVTISTPMNTGANTLTKDGSGTLVISGVNTYSGATTISAGTVILTGTAGSSAFTVGSGGTLRGNNTLGALTVNGLVAPGLNTNDTGTLTASSTALGAGGKMVFDIGNVAGSAGVNWDLISCAGGAINVNSSSGNPFVITMKGNPTGWDNTQNYSWRFIDGASVVNHALDKFSFVTSEFTPSLGGGSFSVTNSGSDLFIVFTAAGGPDIEARGNNLVISSGDTTPSLADHTDFGDVLTTGGTLTRTYTFTNAGVASVGLGNISFSGGNSGDFTLVNQLPDTLAAGGSTNVQITFDPGADGTRSTTVTFTNTVVGKTPYTFTIQGTGVTYNLDVLGNSTIIADGDGTPSTGDHTDFGSVGVSGSTLTRTYTINNTGNRIIGIGDVSVGGTHAAEFSVTVQPAASIAVSGSTTFQVTFDPSATGLREATLSFTNTSSTGKTPYNFSIQGTGAGSGISNFPTTLAFSSVLGSLPSPSFQAFAVTNVGLGSMTYTVATNASWLRYSNLTFTAAAGAGNVHTAHVHLVTGIAAGTSNATITITGDANTTNSPKTIAVTWTISAIPDPTSVTVQGDGSEFVRLFWTKNASHDVLIVHRATNAPGVPANASAYAVNDSIGSDGTRVIYKGAAAFFEHVVVPGTTNHYAFYSINNDYYSPGVTGASTNPAYAAGVIVDTFSYTNGLAISTLNGGNGWSGAWGDASGTFLVNTTKFTAISGYPAPAGNTITGNNASIRRSFPAITSGRVYVSFMMRTDNGGSSQYSGMSFYNGGTEEKFVGDGFSQVNQLTVGSAAGRQLANNTDYTIIARYDFGTDVFSALLYTNASESVPGTEPAVWHVTETDASVTSIDRIRFESNVGTRWDEVRIATNYYELLGITPPGAGLAAGPTTRSVSVMKGNSGVAAGTFSVTNVGGADLIYTNFITYGAGSGWLTVAPVSATVIGGAVQINTGTVSAVSLAAGNYVATNRVDGNQTNAAALIVYTMTVTNIPVATSVSALGDGPEMVRVLATAPSGLNLMIVHRGGQPPSADPADNTPYSVGDTIGSGTVIYSGGSVSHEHVVNAGSTNFYRVYSINNNHYAPSVEVGVTTAVYRVGEIVETFAYTNNATLGASHSRGQGWSGAWSIGSGTWIVKTNGGPVNFTDKANYPSNTANRIRLNNPGNGNSASATRTLTTPVSSGSIYVAAHMSFQYNGADKWMGINLMSNGNVRAFFGEVGHDDNKLGLSSFGSTNVTGTYNFNDFNSDTNNTYLVVGAYNFSTRELKVAAFYRTTTVPTSEPVTWDAYGTVPANYINSIDAIRLSAGSSGAGTLGDAYYDEIRVASSWAGLLGLSQPVATSAVFNQGTNVTDGQVASGAFTVVFDFYDTAGMSNNATLPDFEIWNSIGTRILTNDLFANLTYSDSGRSLKASNTTHAGALDLVAVTLGTYTSRWTAINSNGVQVTNSDSLSNGTKIVFTVVDDDTTAPSFGAFVGQGRTISGAVYTNTEFTGGFWVTGTVTDAHSGLYAASNTFALTRNGSAVSSGVFAVNFANGGATAGGLVSNNFPLSTMIAGAYTLTVFTVDYDFDRVDDALRATNVFSFTVVEPPAAPGLAVGPLTLTYSAMLGSNPDVLSTFSVTNVGIGTLNYTNYQTYGTGASGWFAANPTNVALGATGVRIHTGHVASATFNAAGSYVATNRVDGDQTNSAQLIVITLTVTNIPSPTVVTATPSGSEFVTLNWTESSGRQVLIVSKETNAPSADPANGTPYSVGTALGGGTVVYKGTAAFFEQVVRPGSTNFYNVYTINNDRYSLVTTVGATTTVYGAGVIVESFSYTNNVSLSGVNGGTGWTNAWTISSGGYGMSTAIFSAITGYPVDAGNVVTGTSSSAYREFGEFTSGKVYVSYKFRVSNGSGYAGLSFFNNGAEQIFFGESGLTANNFAIDGGGGNAQNGGTLANDTDYTIIGMYDFDNNIARGWIYTNATQSIPASEPSAHAQITDGDPTRINRVRLESGSGTVVTKWDEIRIATTWEALLQAPPTYIWDAGGGADRDWSTAANWTADTEPTATNNAFIGGSYTGVVTAAGEVAANLFIGHSGTTGTLLQTGGSLGVTNFVLGHSNTAAGVYTMSGGSLTVGVNMIVGAAGAGTAIVHGAGSRIDVVGNIHIGMSNANNRAVFQHNAGTVTVATLSIGELSATEGRYTMTGGVLSVGSQIYMGNGNINSTGRFDVTGGRVDTPTIRVGRNGLGLMTVGGNATVSVNGASADVIIGDLSTSTRTNTLFVNGGTLSVGRSIRLGTATSGNPSFGAMYMSGGSVIATGQLIVADTANSTGIVVVSGGNLLSLSGSGIIVGNNAPGIMAVHGGSVTGSIVRLSDNSGAAGSTLLVGGGRLVATGTSDFEIDFSGTATVTGGVLEAHDIDLGIQAGAVATLNIGGTGTVIANNPFNVGFGSGATGIVLQTGGTLDLVSDTAVFDIGETAGSFGYYTITNGVITTDHHMVLGSSAGTGTGVFHVVGSLPSITIGDGTSEDFTMQSAAAELRVTFVNSGLAPILVQDDINVAGTLTISNSGPWAAGTYTVVTSLNSSAVIGTFSSINWLGGVTGTVTYTDRAVRITVDGNIPNPTNQTATADGREMIRLAWTPTYTNVMIVHRAGSAVSGDPTQGATINVGDSLGGGTVIYKGSATNLEHVVAQGTTHHYEFFSYTGNFYSTGVTASATTEVYSGGEHVEQFAYTNAVALNGRNGGQGWTNAWSVSAPNGPVDAIIDSVNFATFQPQWPDEKANRAVLKTTNSSVYEAFRNFNAVTSGKIYVAALYRREFGEGADGKYSGLRFVSGTTPMAFVGERGGAANEDIFGVSTSPGTPTDGTHGAVNSFPAATDFLIIGRYDFDTDTMSGIYYASGDSVPSIEPTYLVNATNASISSIDGISILSGADSGWNGQVFFDEIRVATSWAELLRLTGGPYATNYTIGNATNYVFDGQIRDGTYPVVLNLRSATGIETVSTTPPYFIPNYDLFNPNGTQIVTDRNFAAFAYSDAGQTVLASNGSQSTVEFGATVLGVHTGRWSAISSNGLVTINSATLSNSTPITFTVVDDDTTAPTTMTIHSPEFSSSTRSMHVSSNSTAVGAIGGTSGTNISYRLTDHYLANHVSNATPLVFYFGARDAGSGLSRGTTDADTQSHLTIGSAVVSNVFNWDTTRSSTFLDTSAASATSAWSWVGAFLPGEIDNLVTNDASGVVGSNRVTLTWRDADNDRASDRTSLENVQHGWLVVEDDDVTGPDVNMFTLFGSAGNYTATVAQLLSGSGWSITGRVRDTASGINVNGTSTTQPNISPYFELWDATGVMQLRQAFDELSFANGGATTYTWVRSTNNNALASAPAGIWTAKVVVADADFDRPSDRAFTTNEFAFSVIIGDSETALAVSPNSLSVTSTFGVITSGTGWPNFTVTNFGIGPLIYSASISYSGGSGWLTVNPNSAITINSAGSQIHTAAVNVASLNPGNYQAVIALAGNQTNGTQYVTNRLTVIGYYVNEIVDQFTNTAGGSLNGATGGTGWTNAWAASTFTFDASNLSVPNNYPSASGNKICGSTASEITATRSFPAVSTGKLFAAVAMRKDANDNNGYAGISFMDGGTERAFAGKTFNSQWLGIDFGGSAVDSTFGIYQSTYLIVFYYDFDTDTLRTRAFNPGDTLSLTEPGTWSLTRTSASIASIDGIRIGGSAVGNLCFDEIRVARTWETLLNQFTSEPTLHASALTFNNVTTNSMTVGWTPGNGGARIVIAREGQAVTFSPIDGSNYTANADFLAGTDLGGGQKVIFNGAGTSVDFVSLTSSTQYFFRVFEYNASGANYYTNGTALNGSRWTLTAESSDPVTVFDAYTGGDSTITNVWTAPGGLIAPDGYVILRRNGSAVTDVPVDGVGYTNNQLFGSSRVAVINSGAIETFLQSNLTSCVTYHFRIFPFTVNPASTETINYLTNSAATASANTTCEEPLVQASNIVFSVIGTNTITINWENGDGSRRVVVVRGTNAVNQHPVDGMSYTSSATFGSGTHLGDGNFVVYRDTGTTVTVVGLGPGITYHFRVYEFNGSAGGSDYNTNTAVNNPRSTATAAFGLVYDGFDHGSFVNLSGLGGGTGWTNNWITSGGKVETGSGDYPDFGAYPPDTPAPTRSAFSDLGNVDEDGSGSRKARRNFPAMTSGRMYVALKLNNTHSMGTSDYIGINLLNGTTVTGFFGKAFGVGDRRLSVEHNGTSRTNQLDGLNSGYQINANTDYLIVAMYDFSTKEFKARGYTVDNLAHANPDRENAWTVEMQNVHIDRIDGIQFVASDNNQIVTFDSIRIGPSWEEVMWGLRPQHHEVNGPVPTLVYIGTNYNSSVYGLVITNLTDAELKSSENIDFAVRWESPLGVFLTNAVATNRNIGSPNARVSPNWDPLAIGLATNAFNLDKFFTNFFGANGSTVVTSYHFNAFNITNIDFENEYFVTVSAENNPSGGTVAAPNGGTWDAVPTNRAITINTPLRFYITDDDTNVPVRGANGMVVMTNNAVVANVQQVGDIRRHFVTDGVLASNGMDVSIRAYDTYSGIQRAASGSASTNMNVTIVGLVTNDTANFISARSSTNTTVSTASNTWSFVNTLFDWQAITDLWGGDGSGSQGQDFDVLAMVPDADDDRVADQSVLSNELFGIVRITDDDTTAPTNQFISYGGFSGLSRSFFMATNGFAIGSGDTVIRGTYLRRSGSGANTIFAVTDEEINSSGSRGLEFVFGAIDTGSGISRGVSGSTNDVMSFSITNVLSGVVTGFNATLSTANNAPNVLQTNVWTFSNGQLSELVITQLMAITTPSGSGAAMVTVSIPDADNDRQNDRSVAYSEQVGYLQVFDDDIAGPTMSFVDVQESTGGNGILATSFETSQNWPSSQVGSDIIWTNVDSFGTWIMQGITHTSLDPKNSGTRRIGFRTNDFTSPYIQLPPLNNPGTLTIYASRVSGGSGSPGLVAERWDGSQWVAYTTNLIDSTTYLPYTWEVDQPSSNVLLRIRRVFDPAVIRSQIYADDFSVTATATWIGTNSLTNAQININWTAAVDDFSGIEDYHIVPPAIGSVAPMTTNDGNPISAAFTSVVQSILGQQGVITGFIFAVDDDSDRSNDRAMGNVVSMVLRVDTNPPIAVQEAQTVIDATIDDTTEIKVTWTNVVSSAQAAGWRQSDNVPLSDWDSYVIRYHELDISSPVTTELSRSSAAWSNVLNNHQFTNMVLSNLNFDARYAISVMGRDAAGNIGPAVTVTGVTTIFSVTQGFNRVDTDLEVQWIWNEERTYDVVYVDALSMSDSFTNMWKWVTTITNAGYVRDTGNVALARSRPTTLSNTMRFYRVSREGVWTTNNATRRGSVEVYVTKPLNLYTGENWHSLFFIPDTATVSYVFNTNILPRGATFAEATKISWFTPTAGGSTNQNGAVTAAVWLASSGQWLWQIGGTLNANADDKLVPLDQGFLIEIPGDNPATNQSKALSMMIIGLVPTQETVQAISGGSSASNRIHVLSHNMPVRVPLSSMGFRGSGFVGNNNGVFADEIRILSQGGHGSLQNPKARIRLRSDGVTWQYYTTPAAGSPVDPSQFVIDPDDAVIVVRRNSGTMLWTNKLWYTPPTKNFTP